MSAVDPGWARADGPALRPAPRDSRPLGARLGRRQGLAGSGTGRARKAWNRALKFVRRCHLYSGLALVPFVVLYGVTAFLFNHPTVWSDSSVRTVPAAELDAAGRRALPAVNAIVAAVGDGLGDSGWQLDPAVDARFTGRSLLQASVDGTRYSVVIDRPNGDARVFARGTQPRRDARDLARTEELELDIGRAELASLSAAADAVALPGGRTAEWQVRSAPCVEFGLLDDSGAAYDASYDLRDGSLGVEPTASPAARRSIRSFLLRLHTAHGYPADDFGARFWWALMVDGMAIAMVAWAGSGLLMWWQMKNLRRIGIVVCIICAVATTWMVAGQWLRLG